MSEENKLIIEQLNMFGKVPETYKLLKKIKRLEEENIKLKQWDNNKDGRNSRQRIANKKLHKENEQLKKKLDKYENPEDMTLMYMWCTEKVKEENEKLKKQLEEKNMIIKQCEILVSKVMDCYCERTDCSGRIKDSKQYDSLVQKVEKQQQEFIKYLEDFISKTDYEVNIIGNYLYFAWSNAYKKVLQKYEEIIGGNKDENNSI